MSSDDEGNQDITVHVKREGDDKEKEELKRQLADMEEKLTLLAAQKFKEKKEQLGAPESVNTPEELLQWAEEHQDDSLQQLPPKSSSNSKGGAGQIPLSAQSGETEGEYDSVQSMIRDLYRKAEASSDKQEKIEAKALLSEMWVKYRRGLRELGKYSRSYTDEQKPVSRSTKTPEVMIGEQTEDEEEGVVEKMNREWRKRQKMRKEHSNEDDKA